MWSIDLLSILVSLLSKRIGISEDLCLFWDIIVRNSSIPVPSLAFKSFILKCDHFRTLIKFYNPISALISAKVVGEASLYLENLFLLYLIYWLVQSTSCCNIVSGKYNFLASIGDVALCAIPCTSGKRTILCWGALIFCCLGCMYHTVWSIVGCYCTWFWCYWLALKCHITLPTILCSPSNALEN